MLSFAKIDAVLFPVTIATSRELIGPMIATAGRRGTFQRNVRLAHVTRILKCTA
jgi:hypothetical protein